MSSCFGNLDCFCRDNSSSSEDSEDDSDVKSVDFSHCGLNDVPDNIFLKERTLEKLYLESNQIYELPWSIFNCRYLKILDVRDNNIQTIPEAINLLTSLEYLDVSRNALTEIHPNIRECKKLRILNLSVNSFGVLPDVVTQLSSLEELYLNEVNISLLTANIGRLRYLKILELRANKLSFLPSSCSKLSNLARLDIGMNNISEAQPVFISLRNLEELWFDCNGANCLSFLRNLVNMDVLDFDDNNLEELPKEIRYCKNLLYLSVQENYIKRLPIELNRLTELKVMKLDDNKLTELPITIGNLVSLEELSLSKNKLYKLPSSIGLLRKLVVFNADTNLLTSLPIEIGSCTSLRILSIQNNKLKEIPSEIGHLPKLIVLNLANNRLSHLPLSFMKLDSLMCLWLSYNQGKPLTVLQKMYDYESRSYVSSCYLLPQRQFSDSSTDSWKSCSSKPRTNCRIKFANESEEKKCGLTRIPTPIPMRMKRSTKTIENLAGSSTNKGINNHEAKLTDPLTNEHRCGWFRMVKCFGNSQLFTL